MTDKVEKKKRIVSLYPYIIACLIIVTAFLITRSTFYLFFPYPEHNPDTETYMHIVQQMKRGEWPNLFIRTLGYPILMATALFFKGNMLAVIIAQSLLCLCGMFVLTYSFYTLKRWLCIPVAVGLSFFLFCNIALRQEIMLYSDSAYGSFLMLSFAAIILSLHKKKNVYFFLTSVLIASTILIRPSAIFFLVILGFLLLYMIANKFSRKNILLLILPILVVLFSQCIYNKLRIELFSLAPYDGFERLGPTFSFFEESSAYPEHINAMIRNARGKISEDDRQTFERSWDFRRLRDLYNKYWTACRYKSFPTDSVDYLPNRKHYKKIANDAIIKHPLLYLKFFATMMHSYFFINPTTDSQLFLRNHYFRELNSFDRARRDVLYQELYRPCSFNNFEAATPSWFPSPYQTHINIYVLLFPLIRNIIWPCLWLIVLILSSFRVIQTKFSDLNSFIAFIICLSSLGAGMLVSMVEVSVLRYSYVFDFVYYLCPILLIFLIDRDFKEKFGLVVRETLNRFTRREKAGLLFTTGLLIILTIGFWCGSVLKYPKILVAPSLSALAASLTDNNPNDFIKLGKSLIKAKKYDHAVDAFAEALKRDPKNQDALLQSAVAHLFKGDLDNGIRYTERALAIHSRNTHAYYVKGQLLLQKGQRDEAVRVFRDAKKIDPSFHPKNFAPMNPDTVRRWDEILAGQSN